jgi:D-alanyl-D-alanine carboxypeptidase
LTGAIGLAGYVLHPDQPHRAFAFMYNGKAAGMDKARQTFDRMIVELVRP